MAVTQDRRTEATAPASGGNLAVELIAKARVAWDAGRKDAAFDYLDRAVSNTADPDLLRQIHELAKQGYEQAGFIARHTMWGGLVKAVERVLPAEGPST